MLIYEGGEIIKKYPFTKQRGIKDCGPACVQMILKYYNGYISLDKLGEMMNTNQNGTTAYNIKKTLNSIGFKSEGIKSKNIIDLKLPCIAHVIINHSYEHYIVIYKVNIKKQTLLIADPSIGLKHLSFNEFKKIWSGVTIQMYPNTHIISEGKPKVLKFICYYLKKHLKSIIIIQFLTLIISIISILTSIFIPVVISTFLSNKLYSICYAFLIIFSLKNFLIFLKQKILINFNLKLDKELSEDIFYKILNLPYRYYRYKTTGEITSYFNDLYKVRNLINSLIQTSLLEIPVLFLVFLIILKINFIILISTILLIIIIIIITILFQKKQKIWSSEVIRQKSLITSYIVECINGFETIKNLDIVNKAHDSFIDKYQMFIETNKKLYLSEEKESFLKNAVNDIGVILLIIISLKFSNSDLTNFIILFLLTSLLMSYIKNLLQNVYQISEGKATLNNIVELINRKSENLKHIKSDNNIVIKNLNYSFDKQKSILKNINLEIKKEDKVIVTGTSGSGKSTLFKIIKGYYKDYNGSVKINNKEVKDYIFDDITYISQKEILFTGTISDNLNIKNNNPSSTKICEIEDISKNPYYLIEEDGFNLSGGQKQRIVLARALTQFNILIIDEGLNQVSVDMERRILKRLFYKYHDKTIIYISHRLDNLDLFDKLIKIKDGKIIVDVMRNN